jgi:hypothetical protein
LKNALDNTDPVICNSDVVVRPMASHLPKRLRIHDDMLVQDPDFPENLLKYPSRSVAIKGLMDNLHFDHLRCALGLWGPVSGVAIGQSNSSVYVEFEVIIFLWYKSRHSFFIVSVLVFFFLCGIIAIKKVFML